MKIVVATKDEVNLSVSDLKNKYEIIVTGVGYGNVYKALKDIDRDEFIYNIGYAGSNCYPIGTRLVVGTSKNYHPNVEFEEETYQLVKNGAVCYSSNDFVLSTNIETPVLFDMELYAIMSMGFKKVISVKVVSDNLNHKQYEERTINNGN